MYKLTLFTIKSESLFQGFISLSRHILKTSYGCFNDLLDNNLSVNIENGICEVNSFSNFSSNVLDGNQIIDRCLIEKENLKGKKRDIVYCVCRRISNRRDSKYLAFQSLLVFFKESPLKKSQDLLLWNGFEPNSNKVRELSMFLENLMQSLTISKISHKDRLNYILCITYGIHIYNILNS